MTTSQEAKRLSRKGYDKERYQRGKKKEAVEVAKKKAYSKEYYQLKTKPKRLMNKKTTTSHFAPSPLRDHPETPIPVPVQTPMLLASVNNWNDDTAGTRDADDSSVSKKLLFSPRNKEELYGRMFHSIEAEQINESQFQNYVKETNKEYGDRLDAHGDRLDAYGDRLGASTAALRASSKHVNEKETEKRALMQQWLKDFDSSSAPPQTLTTPQVLTLSQPNVMPAPTPAKATTMTAASPSSYRNPDGLVQLLDEPVQPFQPTWSTQPRPPPLQDSPPRPSNEIHGLDTWKCLPPHQEAGHYPFGK